MSNVKKAPCAWCGHAVAVKYWSSDTDHGDRGYVRSCGHGFYVTVGE